MNVQNDDILTSEEIEILQEIMNIAFGYSAADLAEVIDTQVVLSIPFIKVMQITELPEYFIEHVKDYVHINIVEQKFWGKFKGDALLVFSSGAGKELIALLQQDDNGSFESEPVDILERETLLEVGNIIIGACVGKFAELLKDVVTYAPPKVVIEQISKDAISDNKFDPDSSAIILKTDFRFEKGDVTGFLFIVTSNESVSWLREALKIFIEQYE